MKKNERLKEGLGTKTTQRMKNASRLLRNRRAFSLYNEGVNFGAIFTLILFFTVSCARVIDETQVQGGGPGAGAISAQWVTNSGITPKSLAVIVNDNDPQSVEVGEYYRVKRQIPSQNVIHVSFTAGANVLASAEFNSVKAQVEAALPAGIQAYALTWTKPFRVDCMSITAAFALGFNTIYCNTSGGACGVTAPVTYYGSNTVLPYDERGIRPAMMIAAANTDNAKDLIDRGVASDATFPMGTAYMIRTTDAARSVRYPQFQTMASSWNAATGIDVEYVDNSLGMGANQFSNKTDMLFYFQSLANVPDVGTNTYPPGALADHLTSFGGHVPTSSQMSAVRFLEVGATASFGTVVEPCNYGSKFPNVQVVMPFYYRGHTALEAYWKSVAWPGEGLFVGEPLARPFGSAIVSSNESETVVVTTEMIPGLNYRIESADAEAGPFQDTGVTASTSLMRKVTISIPGSPKRFYRLVQD